MRIPQNESSRFEPLNRPRQVGRGVLTAPRLSVASSKSGGGVRTPSPTFRFVGKESVSSALNGFGLTLVAALTLVTPGRCQAADEQSIKAAIRGVLDQQVKDWNDGSIEKFMRGYAKSDATRFASGGEIRLGWQTVFDRYKKTYGDKAAMGKLTFSDLDITVFSDDTALAFGRWKLEREKDEPSGLFTLVFRKTKDGWRIVHDHTSAASKN